jgi:hypothetical protein
MKVALQPLRANRVVTALAFSVDHHQHHHQQHHHQPLPACGLRGRRGSREVS